MKVLHLISGGDVGGAKVQVITLVKALQKKGIQVKLVCFLKGIFLTEAQEAGLNIQLLEQSSRFDFSVVKKLRQQIAEEGYDLIHTHGARANMIGVMLKVNLPVITTIHSDYLLDFEDTFYKKLVFTPLNVLSLKYMDHYITVSPELQQLVVRRGFPQEKTSYVFNGLDFDEPISYIGPEQFYAQHGIAYDQNLVYVGILARLHPVKGHKIFLQAGAQVIAQAPQVRLVIGGDGSEEEDLKKLARRLNIADKVHFLGFIDKPYDFFNAIDINTLTSHSETFPYALLEGAKLKKPSISSRVGGISKLIIPGQTGYLFEPGNAGELAARLLELVNNPNLCQQFGQAIYQHATENFSDLAMATQFADIYQKVIKR